MLRTGCGRLRLLFSWTGICPHLVHGGQAPHFIATQVFQSLIYDPNKRKGTMDDIYDWELKKVLELLLIY